jgi:ubiquitin carboxyl-terminal hydrolase 26/29/37
MKDQTSEEEEKSRLEKAKPKGEYPTVGNLLDLFFSQEIVEARCEKCESKEAIIIRRILRPPRVLVVHLKRFSQTETGRGIKVHEEVEIDQTLNLSKHAVDDTENYQRPIPYDASDYKNFEKNRKKRLEAMKETAKSPLSKSQPKITSFTAVAASSSASPTKAASTSKPSTNTSVADTMESAPKRRKIAEDDLDATTESTPSVDVFDFATQEQEATQPELIDSADKQTKKPSLFNNKSRVICEINDPDTFKESIQAGSATDEPAKKPLELLYTDDDDDDLQKVLEMSKADAPVPPQKTEEELNAELIRVMEESKKEAAMYGMFADEDDISEEVLFPGRGTSAMHNKDATLGELARDQMDIDIQDETQPINDVIPIEDAPTPPPSPTALAEYREFISKPHPGDWNVFPEYGRPDPFEDDELRHSPQLKTDKASRECSYGLLSIIHHIGSSSSHGHYVTDVYNAEDKIWTHHDDSRVETHKDAADTFLKSERKRKGAYLLFYVNKALQTSSKSK